MEFLHTIKNPIGLHARPAGQLVELVKTLDLSVEIEFRGRKVRADRLLQVVSLGAVTGDTLKVIVNGDVPEEEVERLKRFLSLDI